MLVQQISSSLLPTKSVQGVPPTVWSRFGESTGHTRGEEGVTCKSLSLWNGFIEYHPKFPVHAEDELVTVSQITLLQVAQNCGPRQARQFEPHKGLSFQRKPSQHKLPQQEV